MSEVEPEEGLNPIFAEMAVEDADKVVELVNLGALSSEVDFCGHTFGLRTLRVDEEVAVGAALGSYEGNLKDAQVWGAMHIGMALTHVDGDQDFCPAVGPNKTDFAKARFRWVTSQWYMPTVSFLYEEYTKLLVEQNKVTKVVQDF